MLIDIYAAQVQGVAGRAMMDVLVRQPDGYYAHETIVLGGTYGRRLNNQKRDAWMANKRDMGFTVKGVRHLFELEKAQQELLQQRFRKGEALVRSEQLGTAYREGRFIYLEGTPSFPAKIMTPKEWGSMSTGKVFAWAEEGRVFVAEPIEAAT